MVYFETFETIECHDPTYDWKPVDVGTPGSGRRFQNVIVKIYPLSRLGEGWGGSVYTHVFVSYVVGLRETMERSE